jgi:hypothetical protein
VISSSHISFNERPRPLREVVLIKSRIEILFSQGSRCLISSCPPPINREMLSGVPKPWTSGSTSTKTWAPIRPVFKAPAADAAAERASKHESSASIAATGEESSLEQTLDNLDTILDELPPPPTPIKQETNVVTMSSSAAAIKKANNNNNNNSVEMVDDLTKQLVRALDTNDVVGWKSSEESPFGKKKDFF